MDLSTIRVFWNIYGNGAMTLQLPYKHAIKLNQNDGGSIVLMLAHAGMFTRLDI